MSKTPRIILVTNSVPLPDTDFLKYKVFGLSHVFDLHVMCWDTVANKQAFYDKYSDKVRGKNIWLFYDTLNAFTVFKLLFINFFLNNILFYLL